MKSIVFDTGPIISLTTNNLLWVLKPLKQAYKGDFYITKASKYELVDHPIATKRFKFEALQIMEMIKNGTIEVIDTFDIKQKSLQLLDYANHAYVSEKKNLVIVQQAEMQSLAAAAINNSDLLVIDERTTRLLLEGPHFLKKILSERLDITVDINHDALSNFKKALNKDIKIIRSSELVTLAFELGILDSYLADIPNAKRVLLEGLLWGVKLHGCSISRLEIEQIIKMEKV